LAIKATTNNNEVNTNNVDERVGDSDTMVMSVVMVNDGEDSISNSHISVAIGNDVNGDGNVNESTIYNCSTFFSLAKENPSR